MFPYCVLGPEQLVHHRRSDWGPLVEGQRKQIERVRPGRPHLRSCILLLVLLRDWWCLEGQTVDIFKKLPRLPLDPSNISSRMAYVCNTPRRPTKSQCTCFRTTCFKQPRNHASSTSQLQITTLASDYLPFFARQSCICLAEIGRWS